MRYPLIMRAGWRVILFSGGSLSGGNGPLNRCLNRDSCQRDGRDLNEITGQERDHTGSQGGAERHPGLKDEPGCPENVEDSGGKHHGYQHYGVFANTGFISAKSVVKKTGSEGHGNVADDVSARDTECDTNAPGPSGKYGNADTAQQHIDNLAESAELSAEKNT